MVKFDAVTEVALSGIALVFSIIISIGSLAWGYAETGFDRNSVWIISFGLLWLFSQWRGWKWFSSLGLFFCLLLAIIGLLLNFQIGWMFGSAIFALFAWDMTELRQKLHLMTARDDVRGVERRHIARVSFFAFGGLLFASILMLLWRQITLEWEIFLLTVILLGLMQFITWMKK